MSGLLVSVRSAAEALAALEGGADIIDVKEPSRGPLGRADDRVIGEVLDAVAGRRPVSAALGELAEDRSLPPPGLAFVKWGLAGLALARPWWKMLARRRARLRKQQPDCRLVAVAYADGGEARGIATAQVFDFAVRYGLSVLLVDTWGKDGRTLLDLMDLTELEQLCRRCRDAQIRVALAGSLTEREIIRLRHLEPDWFAVRGAACCGGREGEVQAERVRTLADLIRP